MNAAVGVPLLVLVLALSAWLAVFVGRDTRRRGQWWWWLFAVMAFLVPILGAYLLLRNRVPLLQDMSGSRPPSQRIWGG